MEPATTALGTIVGLVIALYMPIFEIIDQVQWLRPAAHRSRLPELSSAGRSCTAARRTSPASSAHERSEPWLGHSDR